jgi:hypothetical protein
MASVQEAGAPESTGARLVSDFEHLPSVLTTREAAEAFSDRSEGNAESHRRGTDSSDSVRPSHPFRARDLSADLFADRSVSPTPNTSRPQTASRTAENRGVPRRRRWHRPCHSRLGTESRTPNREVAHAG